jgi:myosin-crossreactive antigen
MSGASRYEQMSESKNEIIKESFNEDFCVQLAYHLTRTFGNSEDKKLKGFWCDGVMMPFIESQLTKKSVNDTKKIVTKAWLGYNGQGEFEMTINFGETSRECYAKGSDLTDSLPSEESMDWIILNIERKTIELQLK